MQLFLKVGYLALNLLERFTPTINKCELGILEEIVDIVLFYIACLLHLHHIDHYMTNHDVFHVNSQDITKQLCNHILVINDSSFILNYLVINSVPEFFWKNVSTSDSVVIFYG